VRIVLVVTVAGGALVVGGGVGAADAPSSGWNDWSCRPSAAHPEPVVLLHGLTGQSSNWDYIAPALASAGYCTFSLTYGQNTNFCGGAGTAPVAESAEEVAAFMDKVRDATGAGKVDLIGHSEGGFISLYIPKVLGRADAIGKIVAIGTHQGGRSPQLETVDLLGARPALTALSGVFGCPASTDVLPGSPTWNRLADGPIAQAGIEYTVINTRFDVFVALFTDLRDPPMAREPGVHHIWVQDVCPLDPVGHISLITDPSVLSMVKNGLDPAHAGPVACGVGAPV
jgi:pimeloyl-ACP methyl ester carboxylesterase